MAHIPPVPSPVKLGNLRNESPDAQLHQHVKEGNFIKVKKLLKKGISVHTINSLGQTPLFIAALLGNGKIVDILLDYGSDPNHRCYNGSTPVHAAAFSGNQLILSKLLDAGGDLRVHDKNGRNPQSWALTAGMENSAQMLEFIQRCTIQMQSALQNYSIDQLRKVGSPRDLVCNPSKFGGMSQGTAESPLGRFLKRRDRVSQNIFSFGFGKFYLTSSRQLGYLASLPIIADKEVVQADDEPTFSFPAGPYMMMTNLMWGGSRVTVKELNMKPHQLCSKLRLGDLLLAEQEYSSKLRHPHLLQLMAVCVSSDLEKTRLVFERVAFGTLYSILHERRSEFPIVHMETIVHLLLQVNDALRFLHSRGYVHRTFSSYAVMVVMTGEAKLTNLEYMIESKDGGEHSDLTRVPIPPQLYKWCAPEVILDRAATAKSDSYSFCVVMQEALTDTIPWGGLEGSAVKDLIVSGQWLEADARVPKPYYDVVKIGLESRPKQRTMNLQDIRYVLKNDLKDLMESRRNRPGENSGLPKIEARPEINICLPSASVISTKIPELQGEAARVARSFTVSRCAVSVPEPKATAAHEAEPVLRMAQSSPVLGAAHSVQDASDVDESLSSFEINEIYSCYPELCGESEEVRAAGPNPEPPKQSRVSSADRAEASSLQRVEIQSRQASCSEESTAKAWCSREELSNVFEPSPEYKAVACASNRARINHSPFEQKFAKCVLDLKICQTMVHEATVCLCRAEKTSDQGEACRRQLPEALWSYSAKVDAVLRNIKVPYSGDRAFLWKPVGPPSRNYVPPPLRVPGMYRPLVMSSVRVLESECPGEDGSRNITCWSDLAREAIQSHEERREGAELNYQLLHPGVSVRRRKNMSPQPVRSSSTLDGFKVADGLSSKAAPKTYEAGLRSEERRMAQSEWTMEVKQMAKKAASGQLGLSAPYPRSGWTSDSEAESVKDEIRSASNREQIQLCRRSAEAERVPAVGLGDHKHPEAALKRSEGSRKQCRSSEFPGKEAFIEWGVILRKNAAFSVTAEDLCRGQLEEPNRSASSSPDISEEFLTPDTEFFSCSPGLHARSEAEMSAAEEGRREEGDLGTSQEICGQKEHPIETGGNQFTCDAKEKHLSETMPEGDLFTPVASTGTMHGVRQEESKERDVSLIDIQDLSSISCEDSCKPGAPRSPRTTHSPTNASTPRSPAAAAAAFSSASVQYKDCCKVALDTTCWCTQEASFLELSTFTATCARGKIMEVTSSPQEPMAGLPEPGAFSDPGAPSARGKGPKEIGEPFPSSQQSKLKEAAVVLFMPAIPEQANSGDRELEEIAVRKCTADCSLWSNETVCLVEETERAHSSLDNVLEGVLRPAADSRNFHENLLDPVKRELNRLRYGNIEMKGEGDESFSESECSAENAEGP